MLRNLVLLLASTLPCLAQDSVPFGLGLRGQQGVNNASGLDFPTDDANTVADWRFSGDEGDMVKGSYDLLHGTYFTTAALPDGFSSSGTYPFWIVGYACQTVVGGSIQATFVIDNGGTSQMVEIWTGDSGVEIFIRGSADVRTTATFTTSVGTYWRRYIAVFESDSDRTIYATEADGSIVSGHTTTTATLSGLSTTNIGHLSGTGAHDFQGGVGSHWFFTGTTPDSTQRAAILGGTDPRFAGVTGSTCHGYWPLDNDGGAAQVGGVSFSITGSDYTAKDRILTVRDHSASAVHLNAVNLDAPTWSSSGGGHAVFDHTKGSELVNRQLTPGVTAAPFQVFAVATADSTAGANEYTVFSIADPAQNGAEDWSLQFAGSVGGDPARWRAVGGGTTVTVDTSSGFSADTPYLLWAGELGSTDHEVEIQGGSTGTSSTSVAPASVAAVQIGARLKSYGSSQDLRHGGNVYEVWVVSGSGGKTGHEAYSHARFGVP